MALCTRCGQQAGRWSQFCPACRQPHRRQPHRRQPHRRQLAGAADQGAAVAGSRRDRSRLAAAPAAGLSLRLTLAQATAVATGSRLQPRWRRGPLADAAARNPRWGVTAGAFVGLVAAAVAATLGLAEFGSAGPTGTSGGVHVSSTMQSAAEPSSMPTRMSPVTVLAAARSAPHAAAVSRFVSRYFAALSTHDYPAYRQLLAAGPRTRQTPASFSTRYGATADTGVTLLSITPVSPGKADVRVRFASHRQAGGTAASPACAHWVVLLCLVRYHGAYLLSSAVGSQVASGRGCG